MTDITPSSGDIYADLDLPKPRDGEVRRDGDDTYVWSGKLEAWVQTKYAGDSATDWQLVKRLRNSEWKSVIQAGMTEADARAMAANMNRVEPDIRYRYVAERSSDDG